MNEIGYEKKKYTTMIIITRREKLKDLEALLLEFGIPGMTVMPVEGNGQQLGEINYMQDGFHKVKLIPKVRVEVYYENLDTEKLIDAICDRLKTNIMGDGKIFIREQEGYIVRVREKETSSDSERREETMDETSQKEAQPVSENAAKMTMVTIITRGEKFEELRRKMCEIGVTGMTVSNVEGCGRQHGFMTMFEGRKKRIYISPKIKVDIVVCSVPVEEVIRVAQEVLYTGKIGDGKIFTTPIHQVIRIRTKERDKDAL